MGRALKLHAWQLAQGGQFDAPLQTASDYGHPAEEYAAARNAVALFELSARDFLRLKGEDRVSFLHGMVTQDVKGLPVGRSTYAAFLTAKGAMVADARILNRPDDLLLDSEPGRGAPIREFLEKYLVSEDVELETIENLVLLGLRGPATHTVLEAWNPHFLPLAPEAAEPFPLGDGQGWRMATAAGPLSGVDLLVPEDSALDVAETLLRLGTPLGLRLAGAQAYEWLRVEAGVPRYGLDMDEKTLPLEANLQRAIHYQKGCYIGQEVVARSTFRGHVNRKLVGLRLGQSHPAARAELKVGERKVGWVTSVVHSPLMGEEIALAYVHRDFLTPGTQLELADGGAPATVAVLPFVKSA